MTILGYILFFTLIGSVFSLIGGVFLLFKEKFALKISHFLASFAAGVLLGAAFFDLLPEAASNAADAPQNINVFSWALIGIVVFFLIERSIHWFHHHEEYHRHKTETKTTIPLIIIGDTVHNFVDGVVIAASFLVSVPLGVVTALSVAAHEIPQEIGDFGLLLHKGLKRKKIILVNVLSASVAILGALITYSLGNVLAPYIPILLALTAGFFIYIASSDLIPEIHYERRKGFALIESLLLILGVLTIYITTLLIPHQ